MLPSHHRLPLTDQKITGRTRSNSYFKLIYSPTKSSHSRAGVIISKKVSPLAVTRNLYRRRLHHSLLPLLQKPPYIDLLVIAYPPIVNLNHQQLAQQLLKLYPHS